MLPYHQFFLPNGLEVIVHEDPSSKMAVFNILYKVGSRNEKPGKTGLAHFFEHLMFGSSKNVPIFDRELERVGGSCNAFTSPDVTNYYISLPASNIETAFWLESDRMLQLTLSEKTIETQRKVVIEEYKQRYLNQPYGDIWHHMRDLAYEKHPYRWPTIGQKIEDIQGYINEDIWDFYESHYSPDNAVLVVGGNVTKSQIESLTKKWFGPIPSSGKTRKAITSEPIQSEKRVKIVESKVPTDALYKAFKMPGKTEVGYTAADLTSDILGFGKSSILEQKLVKQGKLFASIGAYVLGSVDPGLLVISGKMDSGITSEEGDAALDHELKEFLNEEISEDKLQKIKNQGEAMKSYESIQLLNRVFNLAYYASLGSPDLYLKEFENKSKINAEELTSWARNILTEEKSSVIHYKSIPS